MSISTGGLVLYNTVAGASLSVLSESNFPSRLGPSEAWAQRRPPGASTERGQTLRGLDTRLRVGIIKLDKVSQLRSCT